MAGGLYTQLLLQQLGNGAALFASANSDINVYTGPSKETEAEVFSDVDLAEPLEQPFETDGQGNVAFYAEPGFYWLVVSSSGHVIGEHAIQITRYPSDELAELENQISGVAAEIAELKARLDALVIEGGGIIESVNGQVGEVVIDLEGLGGVPAAAGLQYREYTEGAWPVRGEVPEGTIVFWIKRDADDPDPTVGGDGMAENDIALLAQAGF